MLLLARLSLSLANLSAGAAPVAARTQPKGDSPAQSAIAKHVTGDAEPRTGMSVSRDHSRLDARL